ncbi:hypothetical protein F8M41_013758 [Gigaspora margarita]|uniref:Uncharacterized protein n=1 Tax=Gigaspora margarita TaxID=4874 RepID=A0A8H4EUP3_GIGMA|nr:hypothetical protein F8M41_013758 [Gigaspora margarita]
MRYAYFQSLPKDMQDIYLMAQILTFEGGCKTSRLSKLVQKRKRQKMKTFWRYNHNALLCKKVYEQLHGISARIKISNNILKTMDLVYDIMEIKDVCQFDTPW